MRKLMAITLVFVCAFGLASCNRQEAMEDTALSTADTAAKEQIQNSIDISENNIHDQDQVIIPDMPLEATYELKDLPNGYVIDVLSERCILFLKDQHPVSGLDIIKIPDNTYDPSDLHWIWLENAELSDFRSEVVQYLGGMTDGDDGWIAEFASEEPEGHPGRIHRRHVYHVIGNNLYDMWFELSLLTEEEAEKLAKVLQFTEE